jgi:thioredoxin
LDELINVTDAAFERAVLQADRPVVAAFWSREDARAGRLQDVLEATHRRHGEQVRVVRLASSDAPQTHARYEVGSLPQILFFRDGRLVARARGLPSESELRPWIDYLLGRGPAPARRRAATGPDVTSGHPVAVTDADFDQVVLGAGVPALVDFWAAWCSPCRMVAPIVERLAAEYSGRVLLAKLDVDANPATAQRYGTMSIPTLIFFKGGREVDRLVGAHPEATLRARLEALL